VCKLPLPKTSTRSRRFSGALLFCLNSEAQKAPPRALALRDARVSPRRTHTSATPCRPTLPRRPDASPGPSPDPIPSWSWTMARSTRSSSRVACASSECTRACSPATSTWYAPPSRTARSTRTPRRSLELDAAELCRAREARLTIPDAHGAPGDSPRRLPGNARSAFFSTFCGTARQCRVFFGSSLALFERAATGGQRHVE
jgi:hypothetical protein